MYHIFDYLRFIWHQGQTRIFWCGGDVLRLKWWNKWIFQFFSAQHFCETLQEYNHLLEKGIIAEVKPLYAGEMLEISYKQSDRPEVFVCGHPGREKEYGIDLIFEIAPLVPDITFHIYGIPYDKFLELYTKLKRPNIYCHGIVSEEEFNEQIKDYQAGIRLNEFDGFSEVVAKSILLGQYPITRLKYKYIDQFRTKEDLIRLLNELKYQKEPNYEIRDYYLDYLNQWTV